MAIKFNPYKEASKDGEMQRTATRGYWRGWCCKCNTEQPNKGGVFPGLKTGMATGGVVRRFICASCLAKRTA